MCKDKMVLMVSYRLYMSISKKGHKIPILCVGIKNTAGQEIPEDPHK